MKGRHICVEADNINPTLKNRMVKGFVVSHLRRSRWHQCFCAETERMSAARPTLQSVKLASMYSLACFHSSLLPSLHAFSFTVLPLPVLHHSSPLSPGRPIHLSRLSTFSSVHLSSSISPHLLSVIPPSTPFKT